MYNVYIIDDDVIYINIIKKIIKINFPELIIVGHTTHLEGAFEEINRLKPNIIFFDVNIGDKIIFDFLGDLKINSKLIFMSTEKNYAYDAYNSNAIDFVLKPLTNESCSMAISKAIMKLQIEITEPIYSQYQNELRNKDYITISFMDRLKISVLNNMLFYKAEGKYAKFIQPIIQI